MSGNQIKFTPPPSGPGLQNDVFGGAMQIAKGIPNAIALKNFRAHQAIGAALQHATQNGVVDYRQARQAAAQNPNAAVGYQDFLGKSIQQKNAEIAIHATQMNKEGTALVEIGNAVAKGTLTPMQANRYMINYMDRLQIPPDQQGAFLNQFPTDPAKYAAKAISFGSGMLGDANKVQALMQRHLTAVNTGGQTNLVATTGAGTTENAGSMPNTLAPTLKSTVTNGHMGVNVFGGGAGAPTGAFRGAPTASEGAPVIPVQQVPSGNYAPINFGGTAQPQQPKALPTAQPSATPTQSPAVAGGAPLNAPATSVAPGAVVQMHNGMVSIQKPVPDAVRAQILEQNVVKPGSYFAAGPRVPGETKGVALGFNPGTQEAAKDAQANLNNFSKNVVDIQRSLSNLTSIAAANADRNQGLLGGVITDAGAGLKTFGINLPGTNESQEYNKEVAAQALADASKIGGNRTDYSTSIFVDSLPQMKNTKEAASFVRTIVLGSTNMAQIGLSAQTTLAQTNLSVNQQWNVLEQLMTKVSPLALSYVKMTPQEQTQMLHQLAKDPSAYEDFRNSLNQTVRALNRATREGLIGMSVNPFQQGG